jgi:hypothetical protein
MHNPSSKFVCHSRVNLSHPIPAGRQFGVQILASVRLPADLLKLYIYGYLARCGSRLARNNGSMSALAQTPYFGIKAAYPWHGK